MMPDRFADGDDVKHQSTNFDYRIDRTNPGARHGGTLKGISDHLDYLEELGVTALCSLLCLRTICPAAAITVMPPPTITVWIRASEATTTTAA
mgnify:CR=1 FL=1